MNSTGFAEDEGVLKKIQMKKRRGSRKDRAVLDSKVQWPDLLFTGAAGHLANRPPRYRKPEKPSSFSRAADARPAGIVKLPGTPL